MLIRGAVFLTTLSGLLFEIGLTRIYSATIWYHFAFVAISIAMFGMTAGALAVYQWPQVFRSETVTRDLTASAVTAGAPPKK